MERPKLRRRNAALGSRLIGRRYLQNNVFLSRLRPENKGEGKTRRGQGCRRAVVCRNISLLIGTQYEDRIVNRCHVTGRDKDLREAGKGSHAKLTTDVAARLRLRGQSDLARRKGIVETH